ncbi:MAG: 2-oxoacid:ferredoxin oxidoreductase subunit beta [Acidobacteria bacterium]|nr:2-oxoacid:ferredoxin oxidoreductase subunit beta [Acidobacteriota bacterium]
MVEGNGAVGTQAALTKKDFESDQEVRWCPGCGDYAILSAVQSVMPTLGIEPHKVVVVSGIGCSSRFPYYMNTYGMHSIHGRAATIATGLATARPDLSVWVVTGDGDALAIGGNHLIHTLRRNVNLTILMFNNQIYGLTKGQLSPTSERGKVTKSTPFGSVDQPFNPIALALGAEGTFVARALAVDRPHLTGVLSRAAAHRGTSFIEVYQNCNIFNDGAFDMLTDKAHKVQNQIRLEHGKPIRFGERDERAVVQLRDGSLKIVEAGSVAEGEILVHDEHRGEPSLAFALAHLSTGPTMPTPIGIFRDVERPVYGDDVERQLVAAQAKLGAGDLGKLLMSGDTWEVK